jgi:hypothetical protein
MMNRTNRRAEDFDRALTANGGATVDPTMAALVAVAGALATLPQRPAPAFRDALRTRLMAEAASVAASVPATPAAPAAPASPVQSLSRVLAKPAMQVATGGLAAAVAVTGIGIGASRSLPGDALYGLKRAVEGLQDNLAGGTLAQADSVLEHAQTRLDEVTALVDAHASVGRIENALNDLKADLDQATSDLLAQARAGSRAAYDKLAATLAQLRGELSALREQLPAGARDELDAAMATVNTTSAMLAALPVPDRPGPTPVTTTPSSTQPTTPPATHTTAPSTGVPTPTSVSPSTPGVPTPTITVVPTPTVTIDPTIVPTLPPITLSPLVP